MRPAVFAAILFVLCASILFAQDTYEPDDVYTSATELIAGVPQTGHSIDPVGDVDWYWFTLSEQHDVLIETSGSGSGGTRLWLYWSDGYTEIGRDVDGGPGHYATLTHVLYPGTYYVRVLGNSEVTPYTIELTGTIHYSPRYDIYEPDNTPTSATVLETGIPQLHHSLYPENEQDWATFTLAEEKRVWLELDDPILDMQLFASDGVTVIENDGVGDGNSLRCNLSAGDYFIRVDGWYDHVVADYDIQYEVSSPLVPDLFESDDTPLNATGLVAGVKHSMHSIYPKGDLDWVSFVLTEPSEVTLQTFDDSVDGWNYGTGFRIYLADGVTPISRYWVSYVTQNLPSGTYYVCIGGSLYCSDIDGGGNRWVYETPAYSILLNVSPTSGDSYEVDDIPSLATEIVTGVPQVHTLHNGADQDWFSFTVDSATSVVLQTEGATYRTHLELYSSKGLTSLYIPSSTKDTRTSCSAALPPGTYRGRVTVSGGILTSYSISLLIESLAGMLADPYEPDDSSVLAGELLPGIPQPGHTLDPAGDRDYVRFSLSEESGAYLQTNGSSGSLLLHLSGPGINISDSDYGAGKYFPSITSNLPPGNYTAYVEEYRESIDASAYSISLSLFPPIETDTYEEDDWATRASLLQAGNPQEHHSLYPDGDRDWARFTVFADCSARVETVGLGRTTLALHDQSDFYRDMPVSGGDSGTTFTWLEVDLSPGDYYVEVAIPAGGSVVPDYTLTLTTSPLSYLPPDVYEFDDFTPQATSLAPGVLQEHHSIVPMDDRDWVTFELLQRSAICLETSSTATLPDTEIHLYASDGITEIAYNDDGDNWPLSTIRMDLDAGVYYARIGAYSGPYSFPLRISDYSILLTASAGSWGDAYEPDDAWETATPLIPNVTQEHHSIYPAWEQDWVSFELAQPSYIEVLTTGSQDLRVAMMGSDWMFPITDSWGLQTGRTLFPPGTYYVRTSVRLGANEGEVFDYSIHLAAEGVSPADPYEVDDKAIWANLLLPDSPQPGHSIAPVEDQDWFEISIPEPSQIVLEAVAAAEPPQMKIFDRSARNQPGPGGLTPVEQSSTGHLAIMLPAGEYYLQLTEPGTSAEIPDYTITLDVNPLPTVEDAALMQYGLGTALGKHLFGGSLGVRPRYSPNIERPFIATGGHGQVVLWNAETGERVRQISALGHDVESLAFSGSGTKIATAGADGTVRLWDIETGQELWRADHPLRQWGEVLLHTIDMSVDGRLLLSASVDYFCIWDVGSGNLLWSSDILFDCYAAALSPRGDLVVIADSRHIRGFDTESGRQLWVCDWDLPFRIVFSRDGASVGVFGLTGLVILDSASGATMGVRYDDESRTALAFMPDDQSLLGYEFSSKKLVLLSSTGEVIRRLDWMPEEDLAYTELSPDGSMLLTAASGIERVYVRDFETGEVISTIQGHTGPATSLALDPNGSDLLVGYDSGQAATSLGKARGWDRLSGNENYLLEDAGTGVLSVAVSPDERLVLTGQSDGHARLWNPDTGELHRRWYSHTDEVRSAAFSGDGLKVVSGSKDGTSVLWDVAAGSPLRTFQPGCGEVEAVAFSSDSRKILAVCERDVTILYDARTADLLTSVTGRSAAFSSDSSRFLAGPAQNGKMKMYDASSGAELQEYPFDLRLPVFSPDDQFIAGVQSFGAQDSVVVYEVESGNDIRRFIRGTDTITGLLFTADGTGLIEAGADGIVAAWELYPPRAIIVSGGGDYEGNAIANQTNDLGAYAYKTLKRRGYEAADILYLSAFDFPWKPEEKALVPADAVPPFRDADGDGLNDVDGYATLENLEAALTGEFAQGAGRLMVIMMDHGHRTRDFMTFRLSESQALSATQLDGWLDDLQSSSKTDVTLVVDCCYAGQIAEDCQLTMTELTGGAGWHGSAGHDPATLADAKRIVIASTDPNTESVFLPPPDMTSFMYNFLGSAYMGNSMGEAWRSGRRFFDAFPVSGQVPQVRDGSRLTSSTAPTTATLNADREFFGASWAYGVQSTMDVNTFFPAFDSCIGESAAEVVSPGTTTTVWVQMLPGQTPLEVTGVIRTPAPETISGEPVANLPHVELVDQGGGLWQAEVPGATFADLGEYTLSFTALFNYERLSNPIFGNILVSHEVNPDATPIRAILCVQDTTDATLKATFEDLVPTMYSTYLDRFKSNDGVAQPGWIELLCNATWHGDGLPPTVANFEAAFSNLGASNGILYVHLVGDSATPGTVALSDSESLSAAELDARLDALQSAGEWTVVVVVDAPGSGAFLDVCRARGDQRRVVITSGRAGDGAYFLPAPSLTSFSQKFLSAAYQGSDLLTAFRAGERFYRGFLRYFQPERILPQIDDTGDGYYSIIADGRLASDLYLGRQYAFAGADGAGLPFILDVTSEQTATSPETWNFTARLIEGVDPQRVFAQVVREEYVGTGDAVTDLPEILFTRDNPSSWTWSASFEPPAGIGRFSLTVYAEYPDFDDAGQPTVKLSEPHFTGRNSDTSPPDMYDLDPYNDDSHETSGNVLSPQAPQHHTIHEAGNQDWLEVITNASEANTPFSLRFSGLTLPEDGVLLVTIYEDGVGQLDPFWDWIEKDGDTFTWMAPAGLQRVWISIELFGPTVSPACEYTVEFERNTGANNGLATALGANTIRTSWDSFLSSMPAGAEGFNLKRSLTGEEVSFVPVSRVRVSQAGEETEITDQQKPPTLEGTFTQVNTVPIPRGGDRTEMDDSNLQPFTLYYYQVELVEAGGVTSDWTAVFYKKTEPARENDPDQGTMAEDWMLFH